MKTPSKFAPLEGLKALSTGPAMRFWEALKRWDSKYPFSHFLISLGLSTVVVLMTKHESAQDLLPSYREGDLARQTIRSQRDLEVVDTLATDNLRMEVFSRIPETYDLDRTNALVWIDRWSNLVKSLGTPTHVWDSMEQRLTLRFSAKEKEVLSRLSARHSKELELIGLAVFSPYVQTRIIEADLPPSKVGIEVVHLDGGRSERVGPLASQKYPTVTDVRTRILLSVEKLNIRPVSYGVGRAWASWSKADRVVLGEILAKFVRPNLTLNKKATEEKRSVALKEFKPLIQKLSRGEVIVREGERVTAREAAIIEELNKHKSRKPMSARWILESIFGGLVLWFLWLYLKRQHPNLFSSTKDSLVLISFFILSVAILKLLLIFELDVLSLHFTSIPAAFFLFLTPLLAPAMILRLLVGNIGALIFSALFALSAALLLPEGALWGLYIFAGCVLGIMSVARCQTRTDFYKAGAWSALGCGALAWALMLAWGGQLPDLSTISDLQEKTNTGTENMIWAFVGGFLGGWLSSGLSLAIIPLLESLLGYTTELKLLELARMDHPLLRELVLKAPGTYHHSIIVGSLAEAGAEAVGARALLVRVGAYYHDIGKIGRAEYFIENQTSGFNPHEHTKPQLSAKIIISHVKEGRALADRYRLGQSLIDFIEQHHGTSLVSYFYNKAKQEAAQPGSSVSPDEVREEDFQYPGPKPQSKESAILALADSCEAATRSLVDPTPARLQGLVRKIMNRALNEGLLDEADITVREVAMVEQAFLRILLSIHHNRIEYPDQEKGLPPQGGHLNLIKNAK